MRAMHYVAAFTVMAIPGGRVAKVQAVEPDLQDLKLVGENDGRSNDAAESQVARKADALLGQLTLDEKISLLGGGGFSTKAIDRLGIPKLEMANGPQGVSKGGSGCLLPCGAALASTWDVALASLYGTTIGMEGRARGVHFVLGPGMNICRVPVNGRNFEYFGEDPVLAGEIAAHWVAASQSEGVIATIKHFAGNNQETEREGVDAQIDERTLNELYLPAFRRAVQQGGALAVMAAYNRLNGSWCADNDILLNHYLRDSWGFAGLVMSDWGAAQDTESVAHGLDLEMPSARYFKAGPIKAALGDGKIQQTDIDNAVRRLLVVAGRMHFLDRAQKRADIPLDRPESDAAARKIADSAVVLLQNENNVLPLNRKKVHRIAVYGPNGQDTPPSGGGSGEVHPFHSVSFLDGIRAAAGEAVAVTYVPMPKPDQKIFDIFAFAHTSAGGPAGLNVRVEQGRDWSDNPGQDAGSQASINLDWRGRGAAPLGVNRSKIGTITYTGFLQVEKSGDYELYAQAREVRVRSWIDGRKVTDGSLIHLEPGKTPSIRVQVRLVDWPSADYCRVGIGEPMMPDMAPAAGADAVVACCGFLADSEHEAADRDFDLPASQQRLVAGLRKANPNTILIINSGGGTGLNDGADSAAAIMQAWYLGQAGGTAIGEILFGDVNPSGRLPATFDHVLDDNPAMAYYPGKDIVGKDHLVEPYTEGLYSGYRGYDKSSKDPRYPFGFGLSYTTYSFKNLAVVPAADGGAVATLDVTNTGKRAGAEVVQLYVSPPVGAVDRPLRELKGFSKVQLEPGATRRVTIPLPRESFAYWSIDKHEWQVGAGTYTIEAGGSERDILAKAVFDVK